MRLLIAAAALAAFVAAVQAQVDVGLSRDDLFRRREAVLRKASRGSSRQFSRPVILATGAGGDGPRRIRLTPRAPPSPSIGTSRYRRVNPADVNISPNNRLPPGIPSVPDRPPPPPASLPSSFPAAAPVLKNAHEVPAFSAPILAPPPANVPVVNAPNVPNLGPPIREALKYFGLGPGSAIADAIPQNTKPITDFLTGSNTDLPYPPQPNAGSLSPNFFGQAGTGNGVGLTGFGQPPPAGNPLGNGFPLPAQAGQSSPLIDILRSISKNSGLEEWIKSQPNGGKIQIPGLDSLVGARAPPVPGLPNIPGLPLLPTGIPRDASGQVDVVRLATLIGRRFTNGRTISDFFPPDRIQSFADNLTESMLPETADVELEKMMGRWFEGINTPSASEERCIVHHYGGLSSTGEGDANVKTFSALKIFREGSEFGQVRYSIGFAFRGGHRRGMLQFHYSGAEGSDPQPFWIYKVGPQVKDGLGQLQYAYAIVSNWIKYPFTVLVRDPDEFKEKYEVEVLRWLEEKNFINGFTNAFNLVQPTSYSECQYSRSTYKVLG